VVLAPTEREARRIAERAFEAWRKNLNFLWHEYGLGSPFDKLPEDFTVWLDAGLCYAGTGYGVVDYVTREAETAGINYMCVDLAFGDITLAEATRTAELFGATAIPAFA
jgi:hypothetical protein